ncbi:MAG: baseplate J/gp47 family protein [Sterolibacterium sp.]|nr:baseplate J/gp47 family protein [Sterolibacterium sp.]
MSAIDLSLLPPPDVVETLSYEAILEGHKQRLISLYPIDEQAAIAAVLALESEPLTKLLEEMSYAELTLRARINDAARAVMLASAAGADLENLSALFGVTRLVTAPGDPDATPPVLPTYETDASLRTRTQLAVDGFSTAGPTAAYRFHAISSSGDVKDVAVDSPDPGEVRVTVLSNSGDGVPDAPLLAIVAAALNAETVRPLTDLVTVEAASVSTYVVTAELTLYPGPAAGPVQAAAQAAVAAYVANIHRLGYDVVLTGLLAALHQSGVQRVSLTAPVADIARGPREAAYCTDITITVAGSTDV